MGDEQKKRTPPGVFILGGLNCLLGFATLIQSINTRPQDLESFQEVFKNKHLPAQITLEQLKFYNVISAVMAIIFLISGLGIVLRKEWARKLTIYFSFAIAAFMFMTVITQPALIGLVIFQAIYLGIFIIYFTNKNIEEYFSLHNSE